MVRQRVRIRFSKEGELRLTGHRDLVRAMERLFRRAELPLSMTEGFHPKPRMIFPSALALGVVGRNEVMELELAERIPAQLLLTRLRAQAPPGLVFRSVQLCEDGARKAQALHLVYEIALPPSRTAATAARIEKVREDREYRVRRAGRDEPLDLWASLCELRLRGDMLVMQLRVTRDAGVRPREVLEALDLSDLEDAGFVISRVDVRLADELGSESMPKEKEISDETGDVDQRCAGGRVPDRDC